MNLQRRILAIVIATALAASPAWAVTYDDIFELTEREVPERTIVQFIVDDGRAFELGDDELADLKAAGVSEHVIAAMLDPEDGRAWLAGDDFGGRDDEPSFAPEPREGDGVAPAGTPLVYSFGYYNGPLSRYYYDDPYYYPFWFGGYSYAFWPSYYAYGWRPADDEYYAYPYNWYDYSSFYCHAYYDPGYWTEIGYVVQPGAGRTVWDQGPRFRDGGVVPPKGGRPDAVTAASVAAGAAGRTRGAAGPPAIREAGGGRTTSDATARADAGSRAGAALAWPPAKPRPSGRELALAAAERRQREQRQQRTFVETEAVLRGQNERLAREWQERLAQDAERAADAVGSRHRDSAPPPPPPAAEPAKPDPPRGEEPREERVPPPPPPPPPSTPPAPAPAPAPEPDPPASRGGRGGR